MQSFVVAGHIFGKVSSFYIMCVELVGKFLYKTDVEVGVTAVAVGTVVVVVVAAILSYPGSTCILFRFS